MQTPAVITTTTFHLIAGRTQRPTASATATAYTGVPRFGIPATTRAAVTFACSRQEIRLVGPPDVLDQLLRDALNALGGAVEANEQAEAAAEHLEPSR